MITRTKIVETSLVLTTGFVGLYLLFKNPAFLILAFVLGFIGIFVPILARFIAITWFKLADALNFIFSKIILGLVYFVVLVPLAIIYKLTGKDKLNLKKLDGSNWVARNKKYSISDIENIW